MSRPTRKRRRKGRGEAAAAPQVEDQKVIAALREEVNVLMLRAAFVEDSWYSYAISALHRGAFVVMRADAARRTSSGVAFKLPAAKVVALLIANARSDDAYAFSGIGSRSAKEIAMQAGAGCFASWSAIERCVWAALDRILAQGHKWTYYCESGDDVRTGIHIACESAAAAGGG